MSDICGFFSLTREILEKRVLLVKQIYSSKYEPTRLTVSSPVFIKIFCLAAGKF